MSWPNRITIARLLLVTPFIVLLLDGAENPAYRYAAMAVAVFIGVCDAADGILARHTGTVTRIGSILDPLADYAFMISAMVAMSLPGILSEDPAVRLPYWVSVTLVSRDVFMMVGTLIVFFLAGVCQGRPSITGKAATVTQFAMVVGMCAVPDVLPLAPQVVWTILYTVWGLTVLLGVVSWLGYLRMGSKLLASGGHPS